MTDSRPQYGEYASPEEQRRRSGHPPNAMPVPGPAAPAHRRDAEAAVTDPPPRVRAHPVDRLITVGLLAYGLVNVIVTAIAYLDPSSLLMQASKVFGFDPHFTHYAELRAFGIAAAIVLLAGWTLTAVWAVSRVRRGRIAWWTTLVGAVVTTFIASSLVSFALLADPAFIQGLTSQLGG